MQAAMTVVRNLEVVCYLGDALHYIYGDFSWCMQQCLLLGRGLYSECLLIESSLSYVCINPHKRGGGGVPRSSVEEFDLK